MPTSTALFSLNLGSNGGVFAPTSTSEMITWLSAERIFWQWLSGVNGSNHRSAIDAGLAQLENAHNAAQQAQQYESSPVDLQRLTSNVTSFVQDAYLSKRLPHSKSARGKHVETLRVENTNEAIAYAFTYVQNENYQFDAKDVPSWRGFLQGISEQHSNQIPAKTLRATLASAEELKNELDRKSSENDAYLAEQAQTAAGIVSQIDEAHSKFLSEFELFLGSSGTEHSVAQEHHKEAMLGLQRAFREQMALRAPVEYWSSRQVEHAKTAKTAMKFAFGAMGLLSISLGGAAFWLLATAGNISPPPWRIAVLVLFGVIGIWATRLIVRLFLSNLHLSMDAAERVTMVQTYLALLESEKLPSDDDRKLILNALFRPGSDGIVKDEGLPHPAIEAITRMGGGR